MTADQDRRRQLERDRRWVSAELDRLCTTAVCVGDPYQREQELLGTLYELECALDQLAPPKSGEGDAQVGPRCTS